MKHWLQNILFGIIFTAVLLFTGLRKANNEASAKNVISVRGDSLMGLSK